MSQDGQVRGLGDDTFISIVFRIEHQGALGIVAGCQTGI